MEGITVSVDEVGNITITLPGLPPIYLPGGLDEFGRLIAHLPDGLTFDLLMMIIALLIAGFAYFIRDNMYRIDIAPITILENGRIFRGIMDNNSPAGLAGWIVLLYLNSNLVYKSFKDDENITRFGLFYPEPITFSEVYRTALDLDLPNVDSDFVKVVFIAPNFFIWSMLETILHVHLYTGFEQVRIPCSPSNLFNINTYGPLDWYINPRETN